MSDTYKTGMATRRAVLSDAHVDRAKANHAIKVTRVAYAETGVAI
jgi:hypothetical protein